MPIDTSKLILSLIVLALLFFVFVKISGAQTIDDLKSKINDRNASIQQLENEIKQYQQDIDALGQEADSLKKTLKELDINKKKLEADTKITEAKIANKNSEIKELSLQIGDKSERIVDSKRVISQSLYNISQMNSASVLESLLGQQSLSDVWDGADKLATLQGGMQDKIKDLTNLKTSLEQNKKLTEQKKAELVTLQNDLKNQAKIIADNVKEKNSILAETKNTEANYNKLLATKKAQKEAFEREVSDLESSLKLVIDPNSIPSSGSGVLKYPLDKVKITQYFGNTEYATKNPSVYKGSGHNGIDFAASIGTPVRAAASGVISNVINTNAAQRCGYGKWIVIKHPNGLSTLYAHLSLTTATVGSTVTVGQLIGYSGNTGFTTGPHLHFGVYVTQGLQTIQSKSCPGIIIPYAAFNAYLNPLSYL
jgi:murein DD-endopeptidase MepM/ murein hydrolase activator NlpD